MQLIFYCFLRVSFYPDVSNPYKSQVSENENVNDKPKLIDRTHVREKKIKTGNVQENAKTNNQDKLINEN